MKFLADENFPGAAVESLREAGYDVVWIAAEAPSSADRVILSRATRGSAPRCSSRSGPRVKERTPRWWFTPAGGGVALSAATAS